ncbi:unnamed protein product [Laminaria digitata]
MRGDECSILFFASLIVYKLKVHLDLLWPIYKCLCFFRSACWVKGLGYGRVLEILVPRDVVAPPLVCFVAAAALSELLIDGCICFISVSSFLCTQQTEGRCFLALLYDCFRFSAASSSAENHVCTGAGYIFHQADGQGCNLWPRVCDRF